jgi:hypothetical protein
MVCIDQTAPIRLIPRTFIDLSGFSTTNAEPCSTGSFFSDKTREMLKNSVRRVQAHHMLMKVGAALVLQPSINQNIDSSLIPRIR